MLRQVVSTLMGTAGALALTSTPGFGQVPGSQAQPLASSSDSASARSREPSVVDLEMVIVTARRTEEDVQKVPITVTTLSEEALKRDDIRAFSEIANFTPALTFCCNRVRPTSNVWIRGVPGVRAYFADAPVQVNGFGLLFDLENVQVLKGPQGTLFGIATNGGAIVNVPRRPTNEWEGYGEVTVGNLGRQTAEAVLNMPVISDKFLIRAGFVHSQMDGIVLDVSSGRRYGNEDYWTGRVSATVRPSKNFENYTIFNYFNSDAVPLHAAYFRAFTPGGQVARIYGVDTLDALLAEQQALGPWKVAGLSFPDGRELYKIANVVNTTTWNVTGNATLKNIFGYESYRALEGNFDTDGLVLPISSGSARNEIQPARITWSEEVQLQSSMFDEMLKLTAGGFYSESYQDDPKPIHDNSFGNPIAGIKKPGGRTHAVYAQGTFDLSNLLDGLSFTAGYRYNWDLRTQTSITLNPATLQPTRSLQGEGRFEAGSYTFGLSYEVSPDTMVYLQNSKGYTSGGLTLTAPPGFQTFEPESLNNVEAGIKSQFGLGGMMVRANVSAYYGWYDNVQVTQYVLAQIAPPPAPMTATIVPTNAGVARIKGVDADLTVVPTDNLELSVAAAYTDSGYTEFMSLDSATGLPIDLSSSPFLGSGKWKVVTRASYHLPLSPSLGDISLNATYAWQSRVYADTANPNPTEVSYRPAYENLDASVNWTRMFGQGSLDASIFVNNITENMWATGGVLGYTSLGFTSTALAQPRTYGARIRYSF